MAANRARVHDLSSHLSMFRRHVTADQKSSKFEFGVKIVKLVVKDLNSVYFKFGVKGRVTVGLTILNLV